MKNNKNLTIGIDIGGTKMAAVLFDGGKVLADSALATPKDTVEHILIMLQALVEPLFDQAKTMKRKVSGIGLGLVGTPDKKGEMITGGAPNLRIVERVKIPAMIEKIYSLPVKMDNDANCFIRGEKLAGAAQKFENVYGLTIGTGIGGGWWVNGGIYQGTEAGANEPGHFIVDCNEMLDLEESYQHLTQFNQAQMAEEAYRGDTLAQKTFDELGRLFGVAMANISNLIAPEAFVIGGSVVESSDLFMSRTKKTMREHIVSPELRKRVKILKSKLGKDACAIGAALLVMEKR